MPAISCSRLPHRTRWIRKPGCPQGKAQDDVNHGGVRAGAARISPLFELLADELDDRIGGRMLGGQCLPNVSLWGPHAWDSEVVALL